MKYATTPGGDEIVRRDLKVIKAAAKQGEFTSLVLFGAFGKGEGLVWEKKPRNDYDILIVDPDEKAMKALSQLELGCIVEVHRVTSKELKEAKPTQFWFEIAHASTLLAGKPLLLPNWKPWEIPYQDAITSLNKRCISMLVGKYEMGKENADLRKVLEQIDKAIIALGDAMLIKRGQFHPKYSMRSLMLSSDEISGLYQLAVSTKILGFPDLARDQIWDMWHRTRQIMREYITFNQINVSFSEILFSVTDRTTQEELKESLTRLGAERWI